jgi:predicted aspartyl protease
MLSPERVYDENRRVCVGQVKIEITLRNAPDVVMARLGHLPPEQVHTYTTQGLIDTGATRSVLPPFVTERLGLIRLSHTEARYANGLPEEVDVTEPFLVEILGRETSDDAMVVGEDVLLGITILEKLDLLVDCTRQRLIPNPAHPDQPVFRV